MISSLGDLFLVEREIISWIVWILNMNLRAGVPRIELTPGDLQQFAESSNITIKIYSLKICKLRVKIKHQGLEAKKKTIIFSNEINQTPDQKFLQHGQHHEFPI